MAEEFDKFVVRFNKNVSRDQISAAADSAQISMNSFVLQAIAEKLERGARIDRLLGAAENYLRIGEDGK